MPNQEHDNFNAPQLRQARDDIAALSSDLHAKHT